MPQHNRTTPGIPLGAEADFTRKPLSGSRGLLDFPVGQPRSEVFHSEPMMTVDQLLSALNFDTAGQTGLLDFPQGPPRSEVFQQPQPIEFAERTRDLNFAPGALDYVPDPNNQLPAPSQTFNFADESVPSPAQPNLARNLARINRITGQEFDSIEAAEQQLGAVGMLSLPLLDTAQHAGRGFGMVGDWLFGSKETEQGEPHVGGGEHNVLASAFLPEGMAGMGVGQRGQEGRNISESLAAPLPPTGEEVFGGVPDMPTLGHDSVDAMTGSLADLRPEEFERRGINFADVFHGMGQGLLQAGRAPTMAEALLGAGTGAAAFQQQHEAEQDAMEQQRNEQIRQHQIMEAETAFAGEQMLVEQEQQLWRNSLELLQAGAEQDARRMQEVLRRTDMDVDSDGRIIIRQPGVDENGDPTIDMRVIQPEEIQDDLTLFSQRIAEGEMELPDVGGRGLNTMVQMMGPDVQADYFSAMAYALGHPGDRIPTAEGQAVLDGIRAEAIQRVEEGRSVHLRGTDKEDAVDAEMVTLLMNYSARFPDLRFQLWAGSGNQLLQQVGTKMLGTLTDEERGLPEPGQQTESAQPVSQTDETPQPQGGMQ